jgi:DNA-binding NarL/FixJ family response regulator
MLSYTIRVYLIDDHPPFRVGMRVLLEQDPEIGVVGEADNGKTALAQLEAMPSDGQPHVVVLDCQLPDIDGPTVAATLRERGAPCRILALSAYDDLEYVRGLLSAGATGYLLKNEAPSTIVAAVRAAAEGKAYFSSAIASRLAELAQPSLPVEPPTPREQEVLELLARGLTNAEIGRALGIGERTVRFHLENLFTRLHVDNRVEAVMKAMELGWVDSPR